MHLVFLLASHPVAVVFLAELERTTADLFAQPTENSYLASLAQKDIKKMAQKVGKEGVEVALEALGDQPELFLGETVDFVFHLLVLLRAKGHSLAEVEAVLRGGAVFVGGGGYGAGEVLAPSKLIW